MRICRAIDLTLWAAARCRFAFRQRRNPQGMGFGLMRLEHRCRVRCAMWKSETLFMHICINDGHGVFCC